MGYKEKLKDLRGNNTPYLDIAYKFIAKSSDGKPGFIHYDRDSRTNVVLDKPIRGVFLGTAMKISIYSDDLGSHGGMYESSYYYQNSNIVLRDNTGTVMVRGTEDDLKAFASRHNLQTAIKKRQALLIVTNEGLCAIQTNVILGIDNLRSIKKDDLLEYYVDVTPAMYSIDDHSVSKNAHERLGKFAKKNPPCYAKVTLSDVRFGEKEAEEMKLEYYIDNFIAWKERQSKGKVDAEPEEVKQEQEVAQPPNSPPQSESADGSELEQKDDLPF